MTFSQSRLRSLQYVDFPAEHILVENLKSNVYKGGQQLTLMITIGIMFIMYVVRIFEKHVFLPLIIPSAIKVSIAFISIHFVVYTKTIRKTKKVILPIPS